MRQDQIIKRLKSAFVNSPPSRLQEMSHEALLHMTTREIEQLRNKLAVVDLFLKNNLKIRANKDEEFLSCNLSKKDKTRLIKELHKGNIL